MNRASLSASLVMRGFAPAQRLGLSGPEGLLAIPQRDLSVVASEVEPHWASIDARPTPAWFEDVTTASGVKFRHASGREEKPFFPEIMGGRVKTLHPTIHGGLLGRRGTDEMGEEGQARHRPAFECGAHRAQRMGVAQHVGVRGR